MKCLEECFSLSNFWVASWDLFAHPFISYHSNHATQLKYHPLRRVHNRDYDKMRWRQDYKCLINFRLVPKSSQNSCKTRAWQVIKEGHRVEAFCDQGRLFFRSNVTICALTFQSVNRLKIFNLLVSYIRDHRS